MGIATDGKEYKYTRPCPKCNTVLGDEDLSKLKYRMSQHRDKCDGVEVIPAGQDGTRMKSTAVDTIEDEPMRMEEDETSVIPTSGFMSPAATLDEAFDAFEMFEKAKARLLRDEDVLWFGKGGSPVKKGTPDAKPYLLKSAWRRMARFFGLSIDIEGKEKLGTGDGYIWTYRYRITHPCGAYVVSEGVCSSNDGFFTKGGRSKADEADVMLKAQTVAINRGVSDLLGSGEVSAEEMRKE